MIDVLVACGFDRIYRSAATAATAPSWSTWSSTRASAIAASSGDDVAAHVRHLEAPAIAAHRVSAPGGMGHAGELETSMLLHLRPDLCHMARVVDETDFIATPNYTMDWIEGGALVANPPWDDDTATGAYGGQRGHRRARTPLAGDGHRRKGGPRGGDPRATAAAGRTTYVGMGAVG
ncbi:MAG: creatininase family protein [Caldilineaceae bacterium]